jgi:hypothetical protein
VIGAGITTEGVNSIDSTAPPSTIEAAPYPIRAARSEDLHRLILGTIGLEILLEAATGTRR